MRACLCAFGMVFALAACAGGEPVARMVSVRLIAFNDFHGNVESGAASLATAIRELGRDHPNHAVVAAGDLIGASPLASSLFADEPTVRALSDAGLEMSAVGNHEFDHGREELLRLQRGARFRWLAANVFDAGTGEAPFPAYEVREFDGVRVAFVGATLRSTPQLSAAWRVKGLRFADEAASVNALVPRIRAQGIEAIVLLVHEGGHLPGRYDDPSCPGFHGAIVDIVRRLDPAVDIIVSGHTHEAYACRVDGRLVTSASSAGRMVAAIDLAIDVASRDVVSAHAQLVPVDARRFAPDRAIAKYVSEVVDRAAPLARRTVGVVHGELDTATDAAGQSALGQFVADAQLAAMRHAGAQAAFANPGGLRAPLRGRAPGDNVSFGDLYAAQPFGNGLVAMTLTGAQLYRLLEQQWRRGVGAARPRLLAVSQGFAYAWDGRRPRGHRVVPRSVRIAGRPVIASGRYRIVANDFLAEGGEGYSVFRQGLDRIGGPLDVEALESYLASHAAAASGGQNRVVRLGGGRASTSALESRRVPQDPREVLLEEPRVAGRRMP